MNQALYRQRFNQVEGNRNFVPVNVEQPTGSDAEPTVQVETVTPTAVISDVEVQSVETANQPVAATDPLLQATREKVLAIMTDPTVTDTVGALAQYALEQDDTGYDRVLDCISLSDTQLYDNVVKHLEDMNTKAS